MEFENPLLKCQVGCQRSFHKCCLPPKYHTLNLDSDTFCCEECESGDPECFICGFTEYQEEEEEEEEGSEMVKCRMGGCNRGYHLNCLLQHQEELHFQLVSKQESSKKETHYELRRCPNHLCSTCSKSGSDLFCGKCCRNYHLNCTEPGTRYRSDEMVLCRNHSNIRFIQPPFHPSNTTHSHLVSTDKTHEALRSECDYEEALVPNDDPNPRTYRDTHYYMDVCVQDRVTSLKPDFTRVGRHVTCEDTQIPIHTMDPEPCFCEDICGHECINRISGLECFGEKGVEGETNCGAGPNCTNRRIANKRPIKLQVALEPRKGWGLRVLEDVTEDEFVIEYLGEVISLYESQKRMVSKPTGVTYMMNYTSGLMIDGAEFANNARFINHSCEPNCYLENVVVKTTTSSSSSKGRTRLGIFADRNIKAGEFLSYSYRVS